MPVPGRRVSVGLELEVARYNSGAADAATVTRRVRAEVDELGDQADDTSRDMDQLALNVDLAARRVDDLGDEAIGSAAQLAALDRQLHSTAAAAAALALVPTSGAGGGIGAGALRAGGRGGSSAVNKLDFSQGFTETRGVLIAALVGAAIVAAPTIGAIIAGGVAGAIGTVGVAGGIAMAAKDPRVIAEAKRFGRDISEEFFGSGGQFVTPILKSLNILRQGFADLELEDTFAKMAPHVTTIAHGFSDLLTNIMPGLNLAFDRMGPFADVAADGLAAIGRSLSMFIDDITASPGAVAGLESLFDLINGLIVVTGKSLRWLSDRYMEWIAIQVDIFRLVAMVGRLTFNEKLEQLALQQAKIFQGMIDQAPRARDAVSGLGGSVETFGEAAKDATKEADALTKAWEELHGGALSADEAMLAAKDAVKDVGEAFKEGGKSIEGNSRVALENRIALERSAEAAALAAQEYFNLTGDAKGAQKIMDTMRAATEKQTGATGAQKKAIHDLAVELFTFAATVPSPVKYITVVHDDVYREFRAGERSSTGRPPVAPVAGTGGNPSRQIPGFAEGGWAPGNWVPFRVGEHGPEDLWAQFPTFVQPLGRGAAAGPMGGQTTVINQYVYGRPDADTSEIANKVIRELGWAASG